MRVKWLIWGAFGLPLSVCSPAQALPHRFADLNWGTPRSEAHRTLTRSGWRFLGQGDFGDAVYGGTSDGHRARVTLKYGPLGHLVAVDARVIPAENRLLGVYEAIKEALTQRSGLPIYSQVSFRLPYREGDGQALEALKRKHALYDTVWFDRHAVNMAARSGVQLEVVTVPFSRLEIRQFYLSDGWTEEYRRRAGPSESAF